MLDKFRKRIFAGAVGAGFGIADLFRSPSALPLDADSSIEHRDEVTERGYIISLEPSYEEVYDSMTGETHDLPTDEGSKIEMYECADITKERKRLAEMGRKFMVAKTIEEAANMHTRVTFGFGSPEQDARARNTETLATPDRLRRLFLTSEPSPEYLALRAREVSEAEAAERQGILARRAEQVW